MSEYIGTLEITEPQEYTRQYETACNYDKYTLLPGVYEILWHDSDYERYAVAEVKATHDKRFHMARYFSATSVDTKTQIGEVTVGLYRMGEAGQSQEQVLAGFEEYGPVNEPRCDKCGTSMEQADRWCGECGCCTEHCGNFLGCLG